MNVHRGILTHRIPAEGTGGLLFALGTAAIFYLGAPAFRPLLGVALLGGILLAPLLRWSAR